MTGIYDDDSEAGSATRQPPKVLAAWIGELLADVNGAQVRKLRELRAALQAGALEWDAAGLAHWINALHSAGRELHFENLQPTWLERITGRYRTAHARFIAAHERMLGCAAQLRAEAESLAKALRGHTVAARRLLVEFDLEWNALQREVDQGVNWLEALCAQLGEPGVGGAKDPQLERLAAHAQGQTRELKRLQVAASISREVGVRAQALIHRRSILLDHAQADAEAFGKNWTRALGKLVADLEAGRTSLPGIPQALQTHDELMKRLTARADACSALHHEEHLLAQQLERLREALEGNSAIRQ